MIRCIGCGKLREVVVGPTLDEMMTMKRPANPDILRGTLRCPSCSQRTAFEMTGGHLTFIQNPDIYGVLTTVVPDGIRSVFQEAELSFYATAYRASATMCRAAVEEMLVRKGFKRGTLERKINAAKRIGAFDARLVLLAHGSRLVGNDAVHMKRDIGPSDIPPVLTATVTLVNHLSGWKP